MRSDYNNWISYEEGVKGYIISPSLVSIIEALKRESQSRLEKGDCLDIIPTLPLMTDSVD